MKRPSLTFKDLDNIEYALWAVTDLLTPKKQKAFRKTYIKIYMALKRVKKPVVSKHGKTMPRVSKKSKR